MGQGDVTRGSLSPRLLALMMEEEVTRQRRRQPLEGDGPRESGGKRNGTAPRTAEEQILLTTRTRRGHIGPSNLQKGHSAGTSISDQGNPYQTEREGDTFVGFLLNLWYSVMAPREKSMRYTVYIQI